MNDHLTSIAAAQAAIQSGSESCASIVDAFLQQIEAQKDLNAYLEVFADEAKARAATLDAKAQSGADMGSLYGAVIAIKDNIAYKGHHFSAASKILEGFESIYSATVVERLLAEDAIIIGRTNCDEFAMGSSNENSAFGPVLNAQDKQRVPGGSSGGSAVAVQAGTCHVALGSDTGGSIRQPASFCGVVGMKPTYGRVSRHGLIAYASSFDQIGPFAHSVKDCALVTQVMAGADAYDATASQKEVAPYAKNLQPAKGKRIGYMPSIMEHPGLEPEVRAACEQYIDDLKEKGHELVPLDFDLIDYCIPAYYVLTTAEASSNLSRFDGVHYGFRHAEAQNMEEVYTMSRTQGFGTEVKNRIMLGTFVLSAGYYDAYYGKAQKVRRKLRNAIDECFTQVDAIAFPSSPSVAFEFGAKSDDPVAMYLSDIFTVLANLIGAPAISLPLYQDKAGLPIGMQLMTPKFEEQLLFDLSEDLMAS